MLALGEKTLFALRDLDGRVRAQRRLASPPSTLCLYARGGALEPCSGGTHPSGALGDLPLQGHNVLMATFDKQLLVWAGGDQHPKPAAQPGGARAATNARSSTRAGMGALVWSAQTDSSPVCLAVASFGTTASGTPQDVDDGVSNPQDELDSPMESESKSSGDSTAPAAAAAATGGENRRTKESRGARGLIVSLDEDGLLSLNYLGTDPPTSMVVAPSAFGELDYAQVESEHQRLQKVIRAHASAQLQGSEKGGGRQRAPRGSTKGEGKSEGKDEENSFNSAAAKEKKDSGPKLLLHVVCPLVADCGGIVVSGSGDQRNKEGLESGNWTYEDLNGAEEAAEAAGFGSNGVGLARFRGGSVTTENNANSSASNTSSAMSAIGAIGERIAFGDSSSTADVWTDEVDENVGHGDDTAAATSTGIESSSPKDRGYAAVTLSIHVTCEGGLEMPSGTPITLQLPQWCICATPPNALVVPMPDTRRSMNDSSSSAVTLQVRVLVLKGPLPETLCGTAACCYTLPSTGEPRMATSSFVLPWTLAAQLASPNLASLKGQCEFKLTLETNQPPTSLRHLFDDVLAHAQVWKH